MTILFALLAAAAHHRARLRPALRRAWLRQPIRGVTWWAAALACASLSVFLAMSESQGGTQYPDSSAWATGA